MITLDWDIEILPTIFPDQTSQVWKLPKEALERRTPFSIQWFFQGDFEVMHLLSLRKLLGRWRTGELFVPYLPYGRQDKRVANDATFNLEVFSDLLNIMHFEKVKTIDVHNPMASSRMINNLENAPVHQFHCREIERVGADLLVYPDAGAKSRYHASLHEASVTFSKERDPATGSLSVSLFDPIPMKMVRGAKRALMIDDICDGGATFLAIAARLREINPELRVFLYVTHGIFSRGREVLEAAGIEVNCYHTVGKRFR